jgi:hypothetical protein
MVSVSSVGDPSLPHDAAVGVRRLIGRAVTVSWFALPKLRPLVGIGVDITSVSKGEEVSAEPDYQSGSAGGVDLDSCQLSQVSAEKEQGYSPV